MDSIKCPACGHEFTDMEMYDYVTYWGEDGEQKDECSNCDAKLLIKETVTRTFDVRLADDGDDS